MIIKKKLLTGLTVGIIVENDPSFLIETIGLISNDEDLSKNLNFVVVISSECRDKHEKLLDLSIIPTLNEMKNVTVIQRVASAGFNENATCRNIVLDATSTNIVMIIDDTCKVIVENIKKWMKEIQEDQSKLIAVQPKKYMGSIGFLGMYITDVFVTFGPFKSLYNELDDTHDPLLPFKDYQEVLTTFGLGSAEVELFENDEGPFNFTRMI